jgi:anti-sigma B factor antagonist
VEDEQLTRPITTSGFLDGSRLGPAALDLQESIAGRKRSLRLVGEIDLATAPKLEAAIERIAASRAELTLDMRGVTFIDSTGLRLLTVQSRRFEQAGVDFELIPGPPHIQRLFAQEALLKQIVKRIVVVHKQVLSKGPEKTRSYLADTVLTVVHEGGFTPAEQALSEDQAVRLRMAVHRTIELELRAVVEDLLGRPVRACECAIDPALGLHIETYLLQPLDIRG